MLLTVKETADAIGIYWRDVYYLVAVSMLDAVRVRGGLRFFPEDVEGFCAEREDEARNRGTVSGYYGRRRCHEVIENFKADSVQADGRRDAERMEGREFGLELCPERHNRISRKKLYDIGQLWFDFREVG